MNALIGTEQVVAAIKTDFEQAFALTDGPCVITFNNHCRPGVFIAGVVASFHYNDGTNSANVSKMMNVGPEESDTLNSPEADKCVQNVIGMMSVMINGVLQAQGVSFTAIAPAGQCIRAFTTGIAPQTGKIQEDDSGALPA